MAMADELGELPKQEQEAGSSKSFNISISKRRSLIGGSTPHPEIWRLVIA
jgi:hypothetical protein